MRNRRRFSVLTLSALVAGAVLTLVVPGGPASAASDPTCSVGGVYERTSIALGGAWSSTVTWGGQAVPTISQDVCIPTGATVSIGNNTVAAAKSTNGGGTISYNANNNSSLTVGDATNNAESWIGALTFGGSGGQSATGFAGVSAVNVGTLTWNHTIPFTGSALVTVTGTMSAGGVNALTTSRPITVASGATATFDGPRVNFTSDAADLTNNGTVTYSADTMDFQTSADVVNNGVFDVAGAVTMLKSLGTGQTFTNSATGTIRRSGTAGGAVIPLAVTSAGAVDLQVNSLEFSGGFTNTNATGGFTLGSGDAFSVTTNTNYVNTGKVEIEAGGSLTVTGGGAYTQNGSASSTHVDGSLTVNGNSYNLNAGTLFGDGSITASSLNNTGSGTVRPSLGADVVASTLALSGAYSQGASAKAYFTTYGATSDALNITGAASLNGKLNLATASGTNPAIGQTYNIVTSTGATTGTFSDMGDVSITSGDGGKVYVPTTTTGPPGGVSLTVTAVPTLDINDATVSEADGSASFTVTRSGTSNVALTFRYATSPLAPNKATAGVDYTTTSGTGTMAVGETTETIVVPIANDGFGELVETFQVKLSKPKNAAINDLQGVGTITNDDGDAPSFSVAAESPASEGSSGPYQVTATITRSGETGEAVSVKAGTKSGSAKAGTDFTAVPATVVSFAAGETVKQVLVTVQGDTTVERDEAFNVALSVPVGGSITTGTAAINLANDD